MYPARPNFFIVGAPKCGTTALYHALRQHPEVFLPHSGNPGSYWLHKEPMFFSDDLGIEEWIRIGRLEDYLALFAGAGDARRIGEASALYLFSRSAPARIRDFAGDDCRIIIMLRPPVDWMRSWHHDCLRYAHESICDFGKALAAEPAREQWTTLPAHFGYKGCLCYRKAARFSDHVKRHLDVFGRERVHIVLMEELNREPARVFREVSGFLGISTTFNPVIARQNDSSALCLTHLWEARLSRKLHSRPFLDRMLERFPPAPARLYHRAALRLLPPLSDKKIEPALRRRLIEEFRPEVDKLSDLLGRDLSHWNEMPVPRPV